VCAFEYNRPGVLKLSLAYHSMKFNNFTTKVFFPYLSKKLKSERPSDIGDELCDVASNTAY